MWTEQTVETLRKFALEGRSAAWIAAALGAPSRNAVIGKANRIGIKLNGVRAAPYGEEPGFQPLSPPAPWGRTISPSAEHEARSGAELPWKKGAFRRRVPASIGPRRRADRRIYATAEVGDMARIGLAEIREAQCRWPLGDPLDEDFAYCGLQVALGHAYCPGHCRLAYRPLNA
jgi:GcrA cell cycle regulator